MQAAPRRVLVTGAGAGIGRAIARRLAERGDAVHICDVDEDSLAWPEGTGLEVAGHVCDVTDRAAARRLVEEAVAGLGGLDVLVDNVGVGGPTAPIDGIRDDEWRHVVDVNLNGTFWVTQAAVPALRESPHGSIVVMSSLAGRFGYPGRLAYATTKWGLIGFAKTLSMELGGDGITVNAVLPGAVAGERLDRVVAARALAAGTDEATQWARVHDNQSVRRVTTPEEIAELVAFLASDAARTISGQAISIDGDSRGA